jgi:predicted cupin superfamily sugar epimerase
MKNQKVIRVYTHPYKERDDDGVVSEDAWWCVDLLIEEIPLVSCFVNPNIYNLTYKRPDKEDLTKIKVGDLI